MKAILFVFMILFSTFCFAGEVTGVGRQALRVLQRHQLDIATLEGQGMKVLLGEVTGAGKKIDLDRIQFLIGAQEVFTMKNLSHIEYIHPSEAKALKDVKQLEFDRQILKPNQVTGIIYK